MLPWSWTATVTVAPRSSSRSYDQCQSSNTSAYINGCKTYYPNYLLWNLPPVQSFPHSFLTLDFTSETVHTVLIFVISRVSKRQNEMVEAVETKRCSRRSLLMIRNTYCTVPYIYAGPEIMVPLVPATAFLRSTSSTVVTFFTFNDLHHMMASQSIQNLRAMYCTLKQCAAPYQEGAIRSKLTPCL